MSKEHDYGLVSVVMPAYNAADYIAETIGSVIGQSYDNWELLIVDDCSNDDTQKTVCSVKDKRIRYFRNHRNMGAAFSRNYALREARGRWIAFLDCDDLWDPCKLELQLSFMVESGFPFTYTDYAILYPNGVMSEYSYTAPDSLRKRDIYRYCFFSTITVIYDSEKVGLIQVEDLKKNNDYAMWLAASEKVDFHRYPKCLSLYCKRDGSISSGSKLRLIKWHYILFRKGMHLSPLRSILQTLRNLFWGVYKKLRFKERIDNPLQLLSRFKPLAKK